jgi:copper homeostasis protein
VGTRERLVIEVCVDGLHSALGAQDGGADRVELCDNLLEGGTTPSAGMIAVVRAHLRIALDVLVRPRGGDFVCSDLELATMRHDIQHCKALGADATQIRALRDG